MAPNVKEVANAIQSLDLQQHVLSKYAPLTALLEQQPTAAPRSSHNLSFDSCWQQQQEEETKEEIIAKIVRDEAIRESLCVRHVTDNLLASRRPEEETDWQGADWRESYSHEKRPNTTQARPEDEDSLSAIVTAPHVGDANHPDNEYWDWPTLLTVEERRQYVIQSILKEEAARALLSTDHMEDNLVRAARSNTNTALLSDPCYWDWNQTETAHHAHDATHPLHDYWDDYSAPATHDEARLAQIATIIEHENVRHSLSADHMEAIELQRRREPVGPLIESPVTNVNYWYWSNEEDAEHVQAPHYSDATHPVHSYWDHDTSPDTKKDLIAKIMKEHETREILSTLHVVENMAEEGEREQHYIPVQGDNGHYWHW